VAYVPLYSGAHQLRRYRTTNIKILLPVVDIHYFNIIYSTHFVTSLMSCDIYDNGLKSLKDNKYT